MRPALIVALGLVVACYDPPKPDCGFRCGPEEACPADYTCGDDGRCHRDGASPSLQCATPIDAAPLPIDAYSPLVLEMYPFPGTDDVSVDAAIGARFDTDVTGVSDASFRVIANAAPVPGTVAYDPAAAFATFTPAQPLTPGLTFTVTLTPAITAVATGQALQQTTWSFTTMIDTTPPTVTARAPAPGATAVPLDAVVTATFDEHVSHLVTGNFTLANATDDHPGTISYDLATRTGTFTPNGQLAASTTYTATLAAAITDVSGNPLAGGPVTWSFTTAADTIAPTIVVRVPAADATDIAPSTSVFATFSEPVTGVSATSVTLAQAGTPVPATVTYDALNRRARLLPAAPLATNTVYTVTLTGAIHDAFANPLAGAPVAWSFTTAAP